jgi:hypothetical protein
MKSSKHIAVTLLMGALLAAAAGCSTSFTPGGGPSVATPTPTPTPEVVKAQTGDILAEEAAALV